MCIGALALVAVAACALAKEPCKGVEVFIASGYVDAIPGATVAFTNDFDKNSQMITTKSDGTGCLTLPPGVYTVKVAAPGFEPLHVAFHFFEVPAALTVVLRIGRVHDPIIEAVRGELKGFPKAKDVWIVMSHLLAQERYTSRLGANGKFEFKGQFAGIYEVRAVSDGKILACTTIEKTVGDRWVDLNPKTVCGGKKAK